MWIKYLKNCFLLLIPILIWNLLLASHLPKVFQPEIFWNDIPSFISIPESIFRFVIMAAPAFMILSVKTRMQRIGLSIYLIGTALYFCSWLVLILNPDGDWSNSMIFLMAPAYLPILWLVGIGLIGDKSFFRIRHTSAIYIVFSILFIVFHCLHAYWVFMRV